MSVHEWNNIGPFNATALSIHMVIGCDALAQDRGKGPKRATTDQEGVVYRLHLSYLSLHSYFLRSSAPVVAPSPVRTRMIYGICYTIHNTWHCVHAHMVYDVMNGSQGRLHGAKNSQENFAPLPISISLFLLRLIPLTLTNSLQFYTMSLAFPEKLTKAKLYAKSRGGTSDRI